MPASRKLKEIEKDRGERRKVRKRTKQAVDVAPATAGPSSTTPATTGDIEMTDAAPAVSSEASAVSEATQTSEPEDELSLRSKEAAELAQLVNEDLKKDIGCSTTGLYELVGTFNYHLTFSLRQID